MPGSFAEHDSDVFSAPPCYISSRSADVILSDVRPTKLATDALNAINAFLDELLHTLLGAARALSTTQLRAGLHKILPTTLGKEAVLEAELELRAYWERTGGIPGSSQSTEDSTFNLQWTFELLRLKCEAYSTLSDTDENSDAETRLFQRMGAEGIPPPKQALLAPASLYLTAIIESICEHIVSNVGRVVARDSSRAIANGQDLFIALCEDSSIYGLFKSMAVYGQIEALSKVPRPRRSMSLVHEDDGTPLTVGGSFRRNGSIHQSRTRLSSESVNNAPTSTTHSSRPSVDKSRAVKMLYNKVSQDFIIGSDPGHRKVDSFASANTKQSLASRSDRSPISPTFSEDTRSQEFDDMMKSGSTMKVSLTPDRLRTMEALNKEKARANGRQKASPMHNGTGTPLSCSSPDQTKRPGAPTPTVRRVGSTIGSEDDRLTQKPPPTSRPRQLSAATASGYTPSFTRVRATSTTTDPSTTLSNVFANKHTLSESDSVISDQRSVTGSIPRRKVPQELDLNSSRPSRTRTVARNRESLDLEDVMAGSDDDGMGEMKPFVTSKQHDRQRGFSTNTKELIAFLAEGPPELVSGENSLSSLPAAPRKSGRLQKMISRITLASDTVKPPRKMTVGERDASSKSMTNLSPLANRPVPPRYPTSGPPSATSSERGSADRTGTQSRQRAHSHIQKPLPACDDKSTEEKMDLPTSTRSPGVEGVLPGTIAPVPLSSQTASEIDTSRQVQSIRPPPSPQACSTVLPIRPEGADSTPMPLVQRLSSPTPQATLQRTSAKAISLHQRAATSPVSQASSPAPSILEHAREMRMMLEHATSAAECRILVDMFLARSKLVADASVTSPPPRDSGAGVLERAIVELFLGDGGPDRVSANSCGGEPDETLLKAVDAVTPSVSSANRTAESIGTC